MKKKRNPPVQFFDLLNMWSATPLFKFWDLIGETLFFFSPLSFIICSCKTWKTKKEESLFLNVQGRTWVVCYCFGFYWLRKETPHHFFFFLHNITCATRPIIQKRLKKQQIVPHFFCVSLNNFQSYYSLFLNFSLNSASNHWGVIFFCPIIPKNARAAYYTKEKKKWNRSRSTSSKGRRIY